MVMKTQIWKYIQVYSSDCTFSGKNIKIYKMLHYVYETRLTCLNKNLLLGVGGSQGHGGHCISTYQIPHAHL